MSSAQYSLAVSSGLGRRPSGPDVGVDTYRSPFSPSGQAHFVWSERSLPLSYILKDNTLPVVVKISEEANVRSEGDNSMDFRQPILLYRQHQVSRLYARNVTSSSGSSQKEVGPYVVIPENYKGFFRPCDKPGNPIASVSAVAHLMPLSMLSCTRCDGYVCVSPIESDVMYQKTSLQPGVYVIKGIVEDEIKIHNGGHKVKKTKVVRCLRCTSEDNNEVLFPLKSSGEFYVAKVDSKSSRHDSVDPSSRVYSWTELADTTGHGDVNCDVTANLVHGNQPSQDCNFTGTLAFKHVTKDNTVIGCTMLGENPRLFELSLNRGPNFVLALNQDCFHTDSPLTKCLKFAKQEFGRYVSEIKVRRDFQVEHAELREGVK
ncbi:uncharacterized protein [Littorina saxatilis]|uniref:CABIT domain-containing protein n=2 Tax=Littorina saxatilis TaxID=31220 RepID=A0AAN9B8K2_9CAEN